VDLSTFFGVAGVIGTVVTIIAYRKSIKRKRLVYDLSKGQRIATVDKTSGDMTISLVVQQKNQPAFQVDGVYAHYVALANIGAEPVRRGDLPNSDPLRLTITKGRILNVRIAEVTRPAIAFEVEQPKEVIDLGDAGKLSLRLGFEFLDKGDGAVLCVMTDIPDTQLAIKGTVIDMKEKTVVPLGELNPRSLRRLLSQRSFRLALASLSGIMLIAGYIIWFKNVTVLFQPTGLTVVLAGITSLTGLAGAITGVLMADRTPSSPLPKKLRSVYRYSAFIDD
jgi:hypothetical protein